MSEQAKPALLPIVSLKFFPTLSAERPFPTDSFSISVFRGFGSRRVRRVFLGGARRAFPRAPAAPPGGNPFAPHSRAPFLPNPASKH